MAFLNMEITTFSKKAFPLAANAVVNAGEIAVVNASGYVLAGSVATGLDAIGVFLESVDNTGGANGDAEALVQTSTQRTVLPMLNASGGDALDQSNFPRACWISGPNTVADNDGGGTRSYAGKCWGFDDEGRALVEFDLDSDATDISALDARVGALELGAIDMQAVNATLASGTVTINSGITVSAASEVMPLLIGAITGSTNFASLSELKASRVNGAPGVGTVVIRALGSDGALDADAAGAIRVLIFTPAA